MFNLDGVECSLQNSCGEDFFTQRAGVVWISPGVTVKHLTECYRYMQITFIRAQIALITPLATKDFHF